MKKNYLIASLCTFLLLHTANAQTTVNPAADTTNYASTINTNEFADCFPFLTEDGLSIYFASSRNGGHASIFFSKRKNTESYFETPVLLAAQFDKDFDSPSLTKDGLTIYVMNRTEGKLYKATRKNISLPFEDLTAVTIIDPEGKFYAPCISPNGKELVVTNDDTNMLEFYELNSNKEFTLKYVYESPEEGEVVKIGRFSADGLSLYATKVGEEEDATDETLIVLTRKKLTDSFTSYKELVDKNGAIIINSHGSVAKNGSILACTNNIGSSWEDNNIKIIKLKK